MHYSSIFLSALTVTSALAAPFEGRGIEKRSDGITIALSDPVADLGTQTTLSGNEQTRLESGVTGSKGPFATINVLLGANIKNKDLRCQVIGENGKPIAGKRGGNIDINFSDGGKGEWTFLKGPQIVNNIICDPAFKKITPEALAEAQKTFVLLRKQAGDKNPETVGPFTGAERQKIDVWSHYPFQTVDIAEGELSDPLGLRCQIKDHRNRAIEAKRGQNIDVTFSDAGKGEWNFLIPKKSQVKAVICDPKFKSANA